jgi:hypothetical protein
MSDKFLKYTRLSYYLVGLGVGVLLAGGALVEYDKDRAMFYLVAGVISLITGGVLGTLAQRERNGGK